MKLLQKIFSLFIITLFWSACGSNLNQSPKDIAESLDVIYIYGPDIKHGETLSLWVENDTEYCLDFSPNYNIIINVKIDKSWIIVSNSINFLNDKPDILMPVDDPASISFVDVLPDLSEYQLTKPVEAYVVISGHLCDDESFVIEKKIPFTITP